MHALPFRPRNRALILPAIVLLCACVIGRATEPRLPFIALEGSVHSGEDPLHGVEIALFYQPAGGDRTFIAGTVTDPEGNFALRVPTPSAATCRGLALWATSLGYVPGTTTTGEITCTDQCQHFDFNLDHQAPAADYILFANRRLCTLN